ncbi:hypothetical protein [Solidesulfovibrio sp.]
MISSNCIFNNINLDFDGLIDFDLLESIDFAYSKYFTDERYHLQNFSEDTGIFLRDSIKMNYISTGKFDCFLKYVDYFIDEFDFNLSEKDIKALKTVISNLIYSAQTKFRALHYSRTRDHFKNMNGKNVWLKFDSYIKIIIHFEQKGYFYNFKGFWDRSKEVGSISRMIPSKLFIDTLMKIDVSIDKKVVRMNEDKSTIPVVQFKISKDITDANGPLLKNVKKTQEIIRLEKKIVQINNLLNSFNIELDLNEQQKAEMLSRISVYPDIFYIWYRRIFNNCNINSSGRDLMKCGGRLYDETCNIPSEYRNYITINGNKTQELDISATHPSILYATQCGYIPDGDLYEIDYDGAEFEQKVGVKVRDVCKVILTSAINMNEQDYNRYISNIIYDKIYKLINKKDPVKFQYFFPIDKKTGKVSKKKQRCLTNKKIGINSKEIQKIRMLLEEKHKLIFDKQKEGQDCLGLICLKQESDIVMKIFEEFILKRNIPVLQIYDSFIVEDTPGNEVLLRETIINAFQEVTNSSCVPIIKKK